MIKCLNSRREIKSVRRKSPDRLMRDTILARWKVVIETNSPQEKIWPSGLAQGLASRCKTSRWTINRWLHDPDRHPLKWEQLQEIAAEAGGTLKAMFSIKHR